VRLTVAQATIRFLAAQRTSRDGVSHRLFEGCLGIFGHGNVAGLGQALLQSRSSMPYYLARNEQAMVHAASAFARTRNRMSTLACTSSIGPGATNMVTGAALATINRLPVLLLPGDVFATRVADPVLQQLEYPGAGDISVNDSFRPVSRYFDRIWRPEQLPAALLAATRVLTDPAETGAVTLAMPQDVQAQAWDWPSELFATRTWHVRRQPPDPLAVARAAAVIRDASRPLIVAGGGVLYSSAVSSLRSFASSHGIPVAQTQAGKGSMRSDDVLCLGGLGATGTAAANSLASSADVVIGIGTRWTDFTTASRTLFASPDVRFVNLNVAAPDATRLSGVDLVADARAGLEALDEALAGWSAPESHRARAASLASDWQAVVDRAFAGAPPAGVDATLTPTERALPAQSEILGVVNEVAGERGIVVCAAGSMPGDLHKLWRTSDPGGYHVEYGYSCMGYEIAGGLGVKLAAPDREVYVLVGDGSYLMMSSELVTSVAEGLKLVVVLVDNHGFASIGNLSESVGAQRFGTSYGNLPTDLAANAASLGADAVRVRTVAEFREALIKARDGDRTAVICVETDPLAAAPSSEAWWDVPVAEVAELDSVTAAHRRYAEEKSRQRPYL
jgi:3D-(3,5/4)-trihydroxycyclohexane-1,2-dione acylhydrolase (decyclizing)